MTPRIEPFPPEPEVIYDPRRMTPGAAKALREPFPPEAVGKLPRAGITLDFVGHADVTDRLLEVDPEWSWEPFALAPDGAPLIRDDGKVATLWIRLTVCGVTRPGVGNETSGKFDLEKLLVSDALRNAAMRFGVALDLWRKGDLDNRPGQRRMPTQVSRVAIGQLTDRIEALEPEARTVFMGWKADQGFPWPWQPDAVAAMHDELDKIAGGPGSQALEGGDDSEAGVHLSSEPAAVVEPGPPVKEPVEDRPAPALTPPAGPPGSDEDRPTLLPAVEGLLPDPSPAGPLGYETWRRDDLADECGALSLPHSGTKDRLVAELRAYDALHPEHAVWDVDVDERPFS